MVFVCSRHEKGHRAYITRAHGGQRARPPQATRISIGTANPVVHVGLRPRATKARGIEKVSVPRFAFVH